MSVSQEQIQFYKENGFIILNNVLSSQTFGDVVSWIEEFQRLPENSFPFFQYYEEIGGVRQLCRTENFFNSHEGFKSLITTKLYEILNELCGEPFVLFKEKVNYKLPGGGGFQAHQDAPAFTSFGQKKHVTLMVAIDAMTKDNGCLEAVKGKHREGILPERNGGIDPDVVQQLEWIPLECEAGSILIFDSYVPHRSGPNQTTASRRALYLTFNAVSDGGFLRDKYYEEKTRLFPPPSLRTPGVDYSEGAKIFNYSTPIV